MGFLPERARTLGPAAFDAAVAVALAAIGLGILSTAPGMDGSSPRRTAAVVLVLVHTLSLAGRRSRPIPAFALSVSAASAVALLGLPLVILGPAILVAVYSLASHRPAPASLVGLGIVEAGAPLADAVSGARSDASTLVGNAIVIAVAWMLGASAYSRRLNLERLQARTAELERAREELAEAAVAQERLRIARELHDVVGHSLSTIAVQAGVGAHVIDSAPGEAKASLRAIEAASKGALEEVRRVLGLIRNGSGSGELRPAPSLSDLESLASEVRTVGPAVELDVAGAAHELPAGVQLALFRVVQEALTNVIKHARCSRVRVVVSADRSEARAEVVDDGCGVAGTVAEGHGLIGMRERVALFGGALRAGPLPGGGFRVDARVPLGRRR